MNDKNIYTAITETKPMIFKLDFNIKKLKKEHRNLNKINDTLGDKATDANMAQIRKEIIANLTTMESLTTECKKYEKEIRKIKADNRALLLA